jgi:hypothetical protein
MYMYFKFKYMFIVLQFETAPTVKKRTVPVTRKEHTTQVSTAEQEPAPSSSRGPQVRPRRTQRPRFVNKRISHEWILPDGKYKI